MPQTSAQRVRTAMSHREPDRVPLFLPLTMHGALEVGVPVGEYLRSPTHMAEGQMRLRAKYRDDFVFPFTYGALEHEAFGGEVGFFDDGPPTALGPLLTSPAEIAGFRPPNVYESPALLRVLDTISALATRVRAEAPIVGMVMSPFSLPVIQLGFEAFFELLVEQPALLADLVRRNQEFCVEWANAQLVAGADLIGYFDPATSSTILPMGHSQQMGLPVMTATMSAIRGPCSALFASGRCRELVGALADTPAAMVQASSEEDLSAVKAAAAGRLTVMGNLNSIRMRRWTPDEAREAVRDAIGSAAPGGGFILSDSCGEIPIQVPEEVLLAIRDAVDEFGHYPIAVAA